MTAEILLFNLEIFVLSCVLVGLYALRTRFDLSSLYVATGVLLTFMAVAGRLNVRVPVVGGDDLEYAPLYLSLLMSSMVLVYTLEGTKQARSFLAGLCLASLFLIVLKWFLAYHIHEMALLDPDALTARGRERWTSLRIKGGLISTFAIFIDGIVIVMVYQAFINIRRMPIWLGLTVAQLAGMVADGLVFDGFYGSFDLARIQIGLESKAIAGFAASIPTATYIAATLRRAEADTVDGVLHRGALEIVSLRRELESMSAALQKSQVQYEHIKDVLDVMSCPTSWMKSSNIPPISSLAVN